MPCENYREALIETAAMNAAPSRELRAHLNSCATCQAAFDEEAQLFAAIDSGLHATANADVPASLLPRVRTSLSENYVPFRSWIPSFAALAAAAVVVIALVLVRGSRRDAVKHNSQPGPAAQSVVVDGIRRIPPLIEQARTSARRLKSSPIQPVRAPGSVRFEHVLVLVPPGQKQAMDALLASVQQGKVDAEVLLAEKPEKALNELQVAPLEISPVEVKPLSDMSAETASRNEETNR